MKNKELVKELVKLQILCVRWVERNTNLSCSTQRDMDSVLTKNKFTCTYAEGVMNLKNNIEEYCKESKYLLENVVELEIKIKNSSIAKCRFGLEPQKKFTEEEKNLNEYMLKRTLFMINEMVGIKYITENYGLTDGAIKQACQQERLLNTKKVGKSWMVHIPEVLNYWNVTRKNKNSIYDNWEY